MGAPCVASPDEQFVTLMQIAERSQYGKALWLELGAGLRKDEILALDIKDDRVIITKTLIRNGNKQVVKHQQPKTPAGYREVFVDPYIMAKINRDHAQLRPLVHPLHG